MRTKLISRSASCGVVLLLLAAFSASADEKQPMTDAELDAVTAGAAAGSDSEDLLTFEAVKTTRSGKTVTADGSLRVIDATKGITVGNLTLSDGAQSNLQSVININAVNSAVNVLLNLNVNIDSSVGAVNQLNLNGSLPAQLPGTAH